MNTSPTQISDFVYSAYLVTFVLIALLLAVSLWRRFSARNALKRSLMDSES